MRISPRCISLAALLLGACASTNPTPAPMVEAAPAVTPVDSLASTRDVVDAADRSPDDRSLDVGRKPAELLSFAQVQPGMQVAELGAGSGYTTELLARAVGTTGKVYGQNTPGILKMFAAKPWGERLAKPEMRNVVRVDKEFDSPLPADAKNLDSVVSVLFYHDTVWLKANRDAMNRAVFNALKPGGTYVIIDHSARDGAGVKDVKTLHRIDEKVVRAEVERVGFELQEESSAWRNSDDHRDWNASPKTAGDKRGASDRFALRFVKPAKT